MNREVPNGAPEMFAGLVGQIVKTFAPHTEAHPTAIAAHFIVGFGNAVGPGPHFFVGETVHHVNEFLLIVGKSSRSRKGDGKNAALRVFEPIDSEWFSAIADGLSSSEGLIYHVRDPVLKTEKDGTTTVVDEGVSDKRLLLVETEFVSVLKQFDRTGNTLSALLRNAWDSKPVLRTLVKNQPTKATGAHISLIGHTTEDDLHRYLTTVDAANGFGNRFLMLETDRAQLLPIPRRPPSTEIARVVIAVRDALRAARKIGEMHFSEEAAELWRQIYPKLTADQPGLKGSLLSRSEAHVRRLSALFCLFCGSSAIGVGHLEGALAFWDVCEASVYRIFAGRTGNADADRIREAMLPGQELTISELREGVFRGHVAAGRLRDAIDLLIRLGEFGMRKQESDGRPAEVLRRLAREETNQARAAAGSMNAEKEEKQEKGAQSGGFSDFSTFSAESME